MQDLVSFSPFDVCTLWGYQLISYNLIEMQTCGRKAVRMTKINKTLGMLLRTQNLWSAYWVIEITVTGKKKKLAVWSSVDSGCWFSCSPPHWEECDLLTSVEFLLALHHRVEPDSILKVGLLYTWIEWIQECQPLSVSSWSAEILAQRV